MIRNAIPMNLMIAKLSQNVAEVKKQIQATSTEAVTGRVADETKHLSGRIGLAMLSQKAIQDVAHESGLLKLRQSRLDVTQQSLANVQSNIEGLATRLFDATGFESDIDLTNVSRDAGLALEATMRSLNARHNERYLFSGDETSTPPFAGPDQLRADIEAIAAGAVDAADFEAQLDTYFNDPAGGWQTTIYQGSATSSDPEGRTALDPALTDIVRSLAVLAVGSPGGALDQLPDGNEARNAAAFRLGAGETALTNLRGEVGIDQKRLADRLTDLEYEEGALTEAFSQLTARDQYEAAAELKTLEANLEASYMLTARLSNLSLLNFMR